MNKALFSATVKQMKLLSEESSRRREKQDEQMERVSVEPIRCWPHLFYSSRFIMDLRFMADRLCMERMRCGRTFFLFFSSILMTLSKRL